MKNVRWMIVLLLIGSILIGTLGCDRKTKKVEAKLTEVGTFPIVEEQVTLKVFAPMIPTIEDLDTNKFTKYLEDKTNVKIEWQTAPQESASERINAILLGSDLPDVFFGTEIGIDREETYGVKEEIFIPLNDLIEEHAVNFREILKERDEVREVLTATDGNIYSLPSIQDCYHCSMAQKMWINQHWLDELDLEVPTTTDEFYEMLVAFKEEDPNGNGENDEIPLAGNMDNDGWHQGVTNFILSAFVYDSGVYNDVKDHVSSDGKIDTSVNKDQYREGLRFLNKLYTEGLMYEASFTQNYSQMKELALAEEELVGAAPAGHLAMFLDVVSNPDRYRHYTALAPLEGPDGVRQTPLFEYDAVQAGEFLITKDNPYPEVSIRWADSFYDYEQEMYREWGEKDVAWREAEEGELNLYGDGPAMYRTLIPFDEQQQNDHFSWLGIEYVPAELWNGMNVTTADMDIYSADGFEKLLLVETQEKYEPYISEDYSMVPPLRLDEEATDRIGVLQVQLKNYIDQSRVQFINNELDINDDSAWDNYLNELESLGLSEYLSIKQTAYDNVFGEAE